jgi:hypothetical protein
MKARLVVLILILFGLIVSVVSAGGYADPKSFDDWRPATLAQADSMNTVGLFNRAFVHLTGLYSNAVTSYVPITNRPAEVGWFEEYLTLGPVSNRCG